jgi:YhhN-like protein.
VLCFIIVLLIGNSGHDEKDTKLLQIAFFFTVIADVFLVILDYNWLGIFSFCFVQGMYILRHSRGAKEKCKIYKIILCIILIAIVAEGVIRNLNIVSIEWNRTREGLVIIGTVYLTLLCCSLSTAWKTLNGKFYPKYTAFLISIGMTLFFLCDINVGISGIASSIIAKESQIESYSRFLVWIFYLPSQVLLALSGYRR